jgi:LysM domain
VSALGAIEVAEFDEVDGPQAARLRLVAAPGETAGWPLPDGLAGVSRRAVTAPSRPRHAESGPAISSVPAARVAMARVPAAGVAAPPRSRPARPAVPAGRTGPAPLRLTRRGRMVLGVLAAVLATAVITVASMALSGAQAASHGRPDGGYAGLHQIVVQPGQTLWSIASKAAPSADPRQVIQEIMTANSMTGQTVQAGQLLWVPK